MNQHIERWFAEHKDAIRQFKDDVWEQPEVAFTEYFACRRTEKFLRDNGFEKVESFALESESGEANCVRAEFGHGAPKLLIMGELDSVACPEHPEADPETGAVHSCGHCCQAAGLLGVAAALKEPGALDGLAGKIRLMAVPAEELIEDLLVLSDLTVL